MELTEQQIFPYLIPVTHGTVKNSRMIDRLLGRKAPPYIKYWRTVRYRLSNILAWVRKGKNTYSTTGQVD